MLFSSLTFLFLFFPALLFLYFVILHNRTGRNLLLFFASLFFYAWGEPLYVFLLLFSIVLNFAVGLLEQKTKERSQMVAGVILGIGLCGNLGILLLFKYAGFFIGNINRFLPAPLPMPNIPLPIGISFFTFQAISYLVDVIRGDVEACKNPFSFGLYLSFFPQLIAGPIVRYRDIAWEIIHRQETMDDFSQGCCRFLRGLVKKILLANGIGELADFCFGITNLHSLPAGLAWLGAVAYALQIYFDFSGYSDMAIGLGRMFGFHFLENFNAPYQAESVTDFWRRWHISLGAWFRDYVYIPLGGSRVSRGRHFCNLLLVWLLTGFWHGASWNFVLWGIGCFTLIALEKFWIHPQNFQRNGMKALYRVFTLISIVTLLAIFRSPGLHASLRYLAAMTGLFGNGWWNQTSTLYFHENFVLLVICVLCCVPFDRWARIWFYQHPRLIQGMEAAATFSLFILFLFCVGVLTKSAYNPFIYFHF